LGRANGGLPGDLHAWAPGEDGENPVMNVPAGAAAVERGGAPGRGPASPAVGQSVLGPTVLPVGAAVGVVMEWMSQLVPRCYRGGCGLSAESSLDLEQAPVTSSVLHASRCALSIA
jgi:hypothetical protein